MKVGPRSIQNFISHITPNNLDFEKCLHQLKAKGRHVGRTSTSHTCTNKKTIKIERLLTHQICLSSFFCLLWKVSRVIFGPKKLHFILQHFTFSRCHLGNLAGVCLATPHACAVVIPTCPNVRAQERVSRHHYAILLELSHSRT